MTQKRAAYLLATWFGCGLVPIMPGTAGTIGALPLYVVLRPGGPLVVLTAAALLGGVGVWAADRVIATKGEKDPQIVVIDEVVGVLITLAVSGPSWVNVVGSSRVDLQACKLEYSIVSPK